MSFGFSISDVFILSNLAWRVIHKSRKACGEHENLTGEVSALQTILRRLEQEIENPKSPINVITSGDTSKKELLAILADCEKLLRVLDGVLNKYNALSEQERSKRKVWQKVKFGNGEMANLGDLRCKVLFFNTSITFHLNVLSMGTIGRIEQEMNKSGRILRDIQSTVNSLTINMISQNCKEGSISTNYSDDAGAMWRKFRKELRQNGFSNLILQKHKRLILDYIKELGDQGFLDDNYFYKDHGPAGNDITIEDQRAPIGRVPESLASSVDCAQPKPTSRRSVPSPLIKQVVTDESHPLQGSAKSIINPGKALVSSKQAMSHFQLSYIEGTSNQSVEKTLGAENGTRSGDIRNAGKGSEATTEIHCDSLEDSQGKEKSSAEPQKGSGAASSPHSSLSESSSLPNTNGMVSILGLEKSSQTCGQPERRCKGTQALSRHGSKELRHPMAPTKKSTEFLADRASRYQTPSPYMMNSHPPLNSKEVLPHNRVYLGELDSTLEEYQRQASIRNRCLQSPFSSGSYSSWASEGSNSMTSGDSTQAVVGFNAPSPYTLYNRPFTSYSPPTRLNDLSPDDPRRSKDSKSRTSNSNLSPPQYKCLYPGCDHISNRIFDLQRHMKQHLPSHVEETHCCLTFQGGGRVGIHGFARKSHRSEHMQEYFKSGHTRKQICYQEGHINYHRQVHHTSPLINTD